MTRPKTFAAILAADVLPVTPLDGDVPVVGVDGRESHALTAA